MGNYYLVGSYGVFYGVMKNFETRELMVAPHCEYTKYQLYIFKLLYVMFYEFQLNKKM